MSSKNIVIYLDTKIQGALYQLLGYYEQGIFDKKRITVIWKKYKENKNFSKIFSQKNISNIAIKRYKDLPSFENKIILYLFNAQSNCRMVAYREAIHVFVTHGESNKLSSAKPITRIYDYVVVAGQAGIDRFIKQKIFTLCDVENNKIVKMGNTFIGNNRYEKNDKSKTILYAPTWEGGVQEENYSSITADLDSFKVIASYCKENSIENIIIQAHPNTGHRDKRYLYYLLKGIIYLNRNGYSITISQYPLAIPKVIKKSIMRYNNVSANTIKIAFCDISAMEVQLLYKNVPYYIFIARLKNLIPFNNLLKKYYNTIDIGNYKNNLLSYNNIFNEVKDYYISYEIGLAQYSYKQRMDWLESHILNISKNGSSINE